MKSAKIMLLLVRQNPLSKIIQYKASRCQLVVLKCFWFITQNCCVLCMPVDWMDICIFWFQKYFVSSITFDCFGLKVFAHVCSRFPTVMHSVSLMISGIILFCNSNNSQLRKYAQLLWNSINQRFRAKHD
jgi:hypothetical protein